MFSKFKNLFYTGLNKFFHFVFFVYFNIGPIILFKKGHALFIATILMTIIFIPSLQESGFGFGIQNIREFQNSSSHALEMGFQEIIKIANNGELSGIKGNANGQENFSQFSGGHVEFINSIDVQGYPCGGDKCDNSNDCHDSLEVSHNVLGLVVIFFIIAIGINNSLWVIFFTQHGHEQTAVVAEGGGQICCPLNPQTHGGPKNDTKRLLQKDTRDPENIVGKAMKGGGHDNDSWEGKAE